MNWLQLISRRNSVRQFSSQLDDASWAQARDICASVGEDTLKLELLPGSKVHPLLMGFVGRYGRILAPWYVAALAPEDKDSLECLGYRVQRVVLELTALGLGTCWIGGFYKKKAMDTSLNLDENWGVRALIAWGHRRNETWSKTLKFAGRMGKRLSPDKISPGPHEHVQYPWRTVLEAVRWAPSAANRQPWRLSFTPQGIHLYSVHRRMLRGYVPVDMGIAKCHLELACQQLGLPGSLQMAEHPSYRSWEYWTSYVLD